MISNASDIFLAGIIRKNHFGLYKNLADTCGFRHIFLNGCSAIIAPGSEWPNMIYDPSGDEKQLISCFEMLSKKISKQELPSFFIVDSFSKNPEFDNIAKKNGFRPVIRWPGMVRELETGNNPLYPAPDMEFHNIEKKEELRDWIEIINTTLFTEKGLNSNDFFPLLRSREISLMLGKYKGTPCSTMLLHLYEKSAGIYCASTHPGFLGKGIMRNFVDHICDVCGRSGYTHAILEANAASFSLYRKAGFREVCNFDIYWKIQ